MLPYFVSLLILGIPLCWAEWTMGRYGGSKGFNSGPGVFTAIWPNRAAKYFGGVALLIPLIIYMYYVLIEAWCFGYALHYLTGDMKLDQAAIAAVAAADSPEDEEKLGRVGRLYLNAADFKREELVKKKRDALTAEGKTPDEIDTAIRSPEFQTEIEAEITKLLDSESERRSFAFSKFFSRMVGMDENGVSTSKTNQILLISLFGVFFGNFILIYRGITKGIEVFCRFAMPLMAVLALIVLVRVLTLGTPYEDRPEQSVMGGLAFMWNPHPEKLKDPQTWLAASGQIFFSLSVGFGIIVNYASYLRRDDDVVLSGLTASSMNEFFEVCLGGLITLPAAFVFLGLAATSYAGSTFGLGFIALPNVFALMPGGQFFGFLWFFMLFVAAITSSVSMLQPVIAFFEEGLGLKRHASATLLGLVSALGCGFVMYFSKDLLALDTLDFWVGSVMIFLLALFQAIVYGWVLGIDRGEQEAHQGAHIRIPRFIQYILKYVTPVYLLVIFILFCAYNLKDRALGIWNNPVALTSIVFILLVLGFLLLLVHIAGRQWEANGRLKNLEGYGTGSAQWLAWVAGLFFIIAVAFLIAVNFTGGDEPAVADDAIQSSKLSTAGWAVMVSSIAVVIMLVVYCLYRVLSLPPVEQEAIKGPLEIDTGDTD